MKCNCGNDLVSSEAICEQCDRPVSRTMSTAEPVSVTLKPLEWKFWDLPHEYGRGAWDANTPWDTYVIMDCSEQFTGDNLYYCRKISSQFPTLEAAKAAAQTDYEQRILSALSHVQAPAEVVEEEMCPVCGGDCAAANPPMGDACPIQRKKSSKEDEAYASWSKIR